MNSKKLKQLVAKAKDQGFDQSYKFADKRMTSERRSYEPKDVSIVSTESVIDSDTSSTVLFYKLKTTDGFKGFFISYDGIGANDEALQFLTESEKPHAVMKDMNQQKSPI